MQLDMRSIRALLAGRQPRRLSGAHVRARAAVATILRESDEGPEVLLIRRAERSGDPWSGHMAFPGGRREPRDPNLLETARREAHEEVGIELSRQADLLGRLDDMQAVARGRQLGLAITPFVFELLMVPTIVPNEEVAEVLWARLEPLARGDADTTRPYELEGRRYHLPAFDLDGRVVWGLTYQMLQALFVALRDDARP